MKINDLMKQAQQMQEKMQQAQEELAGKEVEGESGAGMVKVLMNGRHDVRKVTLDSSLMTEDKEILEDLLAAASCNVDLVFSDEETIEKLIFFNVSIMVKSTSLLLCSAFNKGDKTDSICWLNNDNV